MEKFRKFADDKTGQNPFLPIKTPQTLLHLTLAILLLPLRLLFIIKFYILIFITNSIFQKNSKIALIIEKGLNKLYLLIFGISVILESNKKLINNKSIYISNFSSYLDIMLIKANFGVPLIDPFLESHGVHKKYFFFENLNKLGDYVKGFSLYKALFLKDLKNQENKSLKKINFLHRAPFCVFYEGLRTNNSFVKNLDRFFTFQIFNEMKEKQLDLVVVKIFHLNKNMANGCQNGFLHFLKSLFQFSNKVFIKFEILKNEDVKIIDSIVLSFKKLMASDKKLLVLDKDIDYLKFLDYYKKNK